MGETREREKERRKFGLEKKGMTQKWVGSDDKDPTLGDREIELGEDQRLSGNMHPST